MQWWKFWGVLHWRLKVFWDIMLCHSVCSSSVLKALQTFKYWKLHTHWHFITSQESECSITRLWECPHIMLTITAQTYAYIITAKMYNADTVFTQQYLTSTGTLIGHGISLSFIVLEASLCIHKNSPPVHNLDKLNAILCCHSVSLRFII